MLTRSSSLSKIRLSSLFRVCLTVASQSTLPLTTASTMSTLPSPPLRHIRPQQERFDLSELATQVSASEERRQRAYDLSRQIQVALIQARRQVGDPAGGDMLAPLTTFWMDATPGSERAELLPKQATRTPRQANLSNKMEDIIRLSSFQHFLQTGQLLPVVDYGTDEEYLAGACMGVAQDLQRYALGRATVRDVESVQAAANLVTDIQGFLLQMDFRNGPLRRKFDGVKYTLKALETLLYELVVTGSDTSVAEPPHKKTKSERSTLIPLSDLEALKLRMEHRDELRESLIKKSRDGQKAAKQSIFALHRGDKDRAVSLLAQCKTSIVTDLLPIVEEEPPLRQGSFSSVLEEYAEGCLFATWLYGIDYQSSTVPSGVLMKLDDFGMELKPEEYIGGLCDLTGEVGRYAVQRGTARDVESVKLCLQTNDDILLALQTMDRLPGSSIGKKMETLRRSVEKIERILYELSLSEAAGGRNVQSGVEVNDNEAS